MPNFGPQQVYVIQHELGPVKIGIAREPEQRLSSLQTACPFKLRIRNTATPEDAQQVEKFLHKRFRKYHMRGEWFAIPPEQRDFDIPTNFDSDGNANTDVKPSNERDVEHEWAELLDRVVRAMKETKHVPKNIRRIRNTWQIFGVDGTDAGGGKKHVPAESVDGVNKDTPKGKVRCASCGHHYGRNEAACPTCGSGDHADEPRRHR